LLRRKQTAEDENNQQALAEMCNKLGNHYMNECKYQNALGEFRQESHIYQALGKNMDFGRANRMIGEVFMMMETFSEALKYSDIYLKLAKQENDFVELQRAYATIGRCYLLKGGDEGTGESSESTNDFKAAEKAFLKSLIICKE
jgi:tetratricopeptide (TPR) repeat protein